MRWSRVFLQNKSFTTFSGSTTARALLFPMEKVFEAYVAQELKEVLRDSDWVISTQDKGHYLFDTPRRFALRPDIVLTRSDGRIVVMDTKWKRLVNNSNKNYGISQADMYQMYAYAKKYGTSDIWLLYPRSEQFTDEIDINFKSDDNVDVMGKEIDKSFKEINGLDWQILIEADYIANATENGYSKKNINNFIHKIMKTESGSRLAHAVFCL